MRLLILCLFLANASTLFSQTVANRKVLSGEEVEQLWKDQQELGDLYKRTAASRFVIVGISSKTELIDERGAQQGRIDDNVAGALYTVEVEDTICKQEDFPLETRPNPNSVAQVVHLFQKLNVNQYAGWFSGKQVYLATGHQPRLDGARAYLACDLHDGFVFIDLTRLELRNGNLSYALRVESQHVVDLNAVTSCEQPLAVFAKNRFRKHFPDGMLGVDDLSLHAQPLTPTIQQLDYYDYAALHIY